MIQAAEKEGRWLAPVIVETVLEINGREVFDKKLYNLQLCGMQLLELSPCLLTQFIHSIWRLKDV